jgi:hypothetical protein
MEGARRGFNFAEGIIPDYRGRGHFNKLFSSLILGYGNKSLFY